MGGSSLDCFHRGVVRGVAFIVLISKNRDLLVKRTVLCDPLQHLKAVHHSWASLFKLPNIRDELKEAVFVIFSYQPKLFLKLLCLFFHLLDLFFLLLPLHKLISEIDFIVLDRCQLLFCLFYFCTQFAKVFNLKINQVFQALLVREIALTIDDTLHELLSHLHLFLVSPLFLLQLQYNFLLFLAKCLINAF